MLSFSRSYRFSAAACVLVSGLTSASATDLVEGPRIGLALGGGGARGIAHVGVIRVLEELRIPIRCISGTSMGAVVGGLYAAGMTTDEMEKVLGEIDWPDLFSDESDREEKSVRRKRDDDRFLVKGAVGVDSSGLKFPLGVVQGQKIDLLFEKLTARVSQVQGFDQLRFPFRAVTTNLETGDPYVVDAGALGTAMRASMSIPGALAPVSLDGKLLVDGGVSNNVPIDVARETCADVVIAVSLGAPLKSASELQSVFSVTDQLTTIMTQQNTNRQLATLAKSDVLIEPDLGDLGSVDFDRAQEAIPIGVAAANRVRGQLEGLSLSDDQYALYQAGLPTLTDHIPVVEFVRIDNDSRLADEVISSKLSIRPGDRLDTDRMDDDIAKIYGMGLFESVDYQVLRENGKEGIVLRAKQATWGPNYLQFGLRLEDDLEGNSAFSVATALTMTQINSLNAEWRTEIQVGQNPRLFTDFYQPLDEEGTLFIDPFAFYRRYDIGVFEDGEAEAVYRVTESQIGLSGGINFDTWGELRLAIFRGQGDNSVEVGSSDLPEDDFDSGGYLARFTYDTLNNVNFPTKGALAPIEYKVSEDALGADADYSTFDAQLTKAGSWGKHSLVGNFKAGYTVSGDLPIQDRFALGGFLNLSGLSRNQISGQYLGFGSIIYYYRLDDASKLLSVPVYLGGSLEAGKTTEDSGDFDFEDLITAGSAFLGADSPLGPFYLAWGLAEGGQSSWYLFLGRTF